MSPDKTPEARGNPVPGHKKGSPFEEGPLIAKAADLGTFAPSFRKNSEPCCESSISVSSFFAAGMAGLPLVATDRYGSGGGVSRDLR